MATLEVDLDLDTDGAEKKARKDLKKAGKGSAAAFAAGFKANLGLIAGAIAGIAAIAKGIDFFKESIRAAAVQQQAINDLNTQLAITGQFTQQVSRDLQEFASNLQNTSRFGDEAILGQLAFAQALGATAEQSKLVVSAGADLAESLNIDLNSAVRNVGKTLGGYAGELGEVIPELKALTTEQLQAGAGIDLIAEKFAGAAQGRIRTFAGATAQLSNVFGDFQEAIGKVVTNSPSLIAVLNTTADLITRITNRTNELSQNGDPLKPLLTGLVAVARTINELIGPFRVFFSLVQTGFNVATLGAQTFITGIVSVANKTVGTVIRILSLLPGKAGETARAAGQELQKITDVLQEELSAQAETVFSDIVTPEQTETFKARIDEIIAKYNEAIQAASNFKVQNKIAVDGAAKDTEDASKQIAAAAKNGIVNAFAQSAQSLGRILAGTGEGFKGFVGVVISALGDLAISIGTTIAGTGKALDFLKASLFGPIGSGAAAAALGLGLVAVGAALKVFGSQFGGGGSPAPSVGGFGSAAGQGIQTQDQFSPTSREERLDPETRVQINVNGDIFDSEETGLRITKILEDASLNENVRVVGGLA